MVIDVRSELEALIRQHGEDYASVSRLIGRNPAYIQQFIKRGTPQRLSEEDRSRLAAYFRVTEERLGGRPDLIARPAQDRTVRNADVVFVPRIDIHASAGPGGMVELEPQAAAVAFDSGFLRSLTGASVGGLSMIRVGGESMEPTLSNGDDILVDRNDGADRLREGIYVLRVEDVLIVKRLTLVAGQSFGFIIRSDNPRYPDRTNFDAQSVELIGRVLWAGRRIG